jgi:hypothetical protein
LPAWNEPSPRRRVIYWRNRTTRKSTTQENTRLGARTHCTQRYTNSGNKKRVANDSPQGSTHDCT